MYFDPLSAWLVALIADGINIADRNLGVNSARVEYDKKNIKLHNEMLNGNIRRVKEEWGLSCPEHVYEQIQMHIWVTQRDPAFKSANGRIIIDLDNQEYIIAVLEECAKRYSEESPVEEHREKAKFFKNAAVEARKRYEQYTIEFEKKRIKDAEEQEKQQATSNVLLVIGLIIIVAFVVFIFS